MVLDAPGPHQVAQVAEDGGRRLEHEHRRERTPRVGVLMALPPGANAKQCKIQKQNKSNGSDVIRVRYAISALDVAGARSVCTGGDTRYASTVEYHQ